MDMETSWTSNNVSPFRNNVHNNADPLPKLRIRKAFADVSNPLKSETKEKGRPLIKPEIDPLKPKRARGRPKKRVNPNVLPKTKPFPALPGQKRGRGRRPKVITEAPAPTVLVEIPDPLQQQDPVAPTPTPDSNNPNFDLDQLLDFMDEHEVNGCVQEKSSELPSIQSITDKLLLWLEPDLGILEQVRILNAEWIKKPNN